MKRVRVIAISIFAGVVLLAGCGGGASDVAAQCEAPDNACAMPAAPAPVLAEPPVPFRAATAYVGQTNFGEKAVAITLDDTDAWLLYTNSDYKAAGFFQGPLKITDGVWRSNAMDFNFEGAGISAISLNATPYNDHTWIGTLLRSNAASKFLVENGVDQGLQSDVTSIAGGFQGSRGSSLGLDIIEIWITPEGIVTGTSTVGCPLQGTITLPKPGNVYALSATLAGACQRDGEDLRLTGVLFYSRRSEEIWGAALTAERDSGMVFMGNRYLRADGSRGGLVLRPTPVAFGLLATCSDFEYQEQAQPYLSAFNRERLDPDGNGLACEQLQKAPVWR